MVTVCLPRPPRALLPAATRNLCAPPPTLPPSSTIAGL